MGLTKFESRIRIKQRIRKVVNGTATKPRLSVFRSNKEIYAQLIDDVAGVTLVAASSRDNDIKSLTGNKVTVASAVGKSIAQKATQKGLSTCAFDRNGYQYHGRVKALADAAREAGLNF